MLQKHVVFRPGEVVITHFTSPIQLLLPLWCNNDVYIFLLKVTARTLPTSSRWSLCAIPLLATLPCTACSGRTEPWSSALSGARFHSVTPKGTRAKCAVTRCHSWTRAATTNVCNFGTKLATTSKDQRASVSIIFFTPNLAFTCILLLYKYPATGLMYSMPLN